jgi:hypothetical protein
MTDALPPATPPSRTGAIAAVVGVLVLALIAAALAVAVLSSREPVGAAPSAGTGPTRSATTAEPVASGSAAASVHPPTERPSSSTDAATPEPAPTGALAPPDRLLPAGSLIRVTSGAVRIREQPSTEAALVETMPAGHVAYVQDRIDAGPVRADGYDWYFVEYAYGDDIWPWQDIYAGDLTGGWMAAGTATQRFVELVDVDCSTEPMTLSVLRSTKPWDRLVCLADGPIVIEGTFGCDTCLDEVTPGANPTWLADAEQHPPIAGSYQYYPFIKLAVPPGVSPPTHRDIVRARLHVDDPAASTCTYTPEPGDSTAQPDPLAVQIFCRERLVLDSFEVIGHDEFGG